LVPAASACSASANSASALCCGIKHPSLLLLLLLLLEYGLHFALRVLLDVAASIAAWQTAAKQTSNPPMQFMVAKQHGDCSASNHGLDCQLTKATTHAVTASADHCNNVTVTMSVTMSHPV
jgi:hypothetical protein